MSKWTIRYWVSAQGKSPIEKWFLKLTDEQAEAVAKGLRILETSGHELKFPHSKPLGGGLFELRERRYGYRVYYCFQGEKIIVLLASGDKTSQDRDIKIARERLLGSK